MILPKFKIGIYFFLIVIHLYFTWYNSAICIVNVVRVKSLKNERVYSLVGWEL